MKPEKLIICGWGPYKEETVIDFSKFNTSLFLITGQTGAGKTTLFDAIAYALYGMLSGDIREKGSVRSDFADENTRTYVELYMTHKNEKYHIIRNPEYMRPKKKKGGDSSFTKEKENAALTLPDGSIIAGNTDVTGKVEEILGMDGKQFRQISMIAQGEFAKMLLASPAEKTAIFRELFGTGIYAAVQNNLRERSAKLYRDYMNYKHKMEEDIALLLLDGEEWKELVSYEHPDFEVIEQYLTKQLDLMKKEIKKLEKEETASQTELLTIKEELTHARQINKRLEELVKSRERLEALEEKRPLMNQLKERILVLQAAKLLAIEEKVVVQKKQAVIEESERLEALQESCRYCKEELSSLEEIVSQKEKIKEAFLLYAKICDNRKSIEEKGQAMERLAKQLTKAQENYLKAQSVLDDAKRRYDEADKMYKNAVIGIAAQYVEEGKPCPVCGSLTHPSIAKISKEVPDEKQLEVLKGETEEAQRISSANFETALRYQNEHAMLAETMQELRNMQAKLQKEEESLSTDIKEYIMSTTQDAFEKSLLLYVENQSKAEEIQRQITKSEKEYGRKRKESEGIKEDFVRKVESSGFHSVKEYEEAVRSLSSLEQIECEVKEYQEILLSTGTLCEHLEESLKEQEKIDETDIEHRFEQQQQLLVALRDKIKSMHTQSEQIKRSLNGVCENRKKAEMIKKEYGVVKDLDDLANGNNARRLVFEQYVLAGYFEQILKAANLRLFDMTDGRYELIRAKQVSDGRKKDNLEILVMDYYTGKERSVKTLSGGETFKASLALALGMSDCIQAENGGVEVETLFIDEGFGALDEESLEQSCQVLQSLAGVNRMIGIISHVSQLKERIESQIIIEKKNYGSSVKVRS